MKKLIVILMAMPLITSCKLFTSESPNDVPFFGGDIKWGDEMSAVKENVKTDKSSEKKIWVSSKSIVRDKLKDIGVVRLSISFEDNKLNSIKHYIDLKKVSEDVIEQKLKDRFGKPEFHYLANNPNSITHEKKPGVDITWVSKNSIITYTASSYSNGRSIKLFTSKKTKTLYNELKENFTGLAKQKHIKVMVGEVD